MANTAINARASAEQVREHADELRAAAHEIGATDVRLLDNGAVVIHSDDPGYRHVIALIGRARDIVGSYLHVVTDDVDAVAGHALCELRGPRKRGRGRAAAAQRAPEMSRPVTA